MGPLSLDCGRICEAGGMLISSLTWTLLGVGAIAGSLVAQALAWFRRRADAPPLSARQSTARLALNGLAGAGVGLTAGLGADTTGTALATALLGWQLLLIAQIDGELFWLPDAVTLPLLASGLAAAWLVDGGQVVDRIIGAGLGFASLWLIGFAYKLVRKRTGLGGGDPILMAAIGAWVGWQGLPWTLLWASTAGLSLVFARWIVRRPMAADARLPFGLFAAVGAWLTWLTALR